MAYKNGFPISVAGGKKSLKDAFIAFEHGYDNFEWLQGKLDLMQEIFRIRPNGIRSLGSCALNLTSIASGCLDAYFDFGIHLWDFAAGLVILVEAGGVCTTVAGRDGMTGRVVCAASSPQLLRELKSMAEKYPFPDDLTPDILHH